MDKLSELSKPVAYKFDHGVMGPGDFKYGTPQMHSTAKDENASPLYSQEYVAALTQRIAELEEEFAFIMGQNDGMEKELRDKDARIEHLEAKLATPVRLPTTSGRLGVAYTRVIPEVIEAIRAAGFTVEVDE
jgi:hypothetical protein